MPLLTASGWFNHNILEKIYHYRTLESGEWISWRRPIPRGLLALYIHYRLSKGDSDNYLANLIRHIMRNTLEGMPDLTIPQQRHLWYQLCLLACCSMGSERAICRLCDDNAPSTAEYSTNYCKALACLCLRRFDLFNESLKELESNPFSSDLRNITAIATELGSLQGLQLLSNHSMITDPGVSRPSPPGKDRVTQWKLQGHGKPLEIAAFNGNIDAFKILFNHIASPEGKLNSICHGLFIASSQGHLHAVQYMMDQIKPTQIQLEFYHVIVDQAVRSRNDELVCYILSQRTALPLETASESNDALGWAVASGQPNIAKMLLDYGYHCRTFRSTYLAQAGARGNTKALWVLMRDKYFARSTNKLKTALRGAVQEGHEDTIKLLMDANLARYGRTTSQLLRKANIVFRLDGCFYCITRADNGISMSLWVPMMLSPQEKQEFEPPKSSYESKPSGWVSLGG